MIVNIITTENFPTGMAATQRIRCYAKSLAEKKIDCKIWVLGRYETNSFCGTIDGYSYKVFNAFKRPLKSFLMINISKIIDLFSLMGAIMKMDKDHVILLYTYSLLLIKLVSLVAKFRHVKVFYELNEHPNILFNVKIRNESDKRKIIKNFKDITGFIVISRALQTLVCDLWGDKKRTILIPILYEKENSLGINCSINNGVPYIFHSGSLTQRKDGIIDMLLIYTQLIKILPTNITIDFLLTGYIEKSPEKAKIKDIIKKNNLESHVKFIGYLSSEDLLLYQKNSYLTIIYKIPNIQNNYCLSTKLAEYLNSGTLVVASDIGDISYYLKHLKDLVLFTEDTKSDLPYILLDLILNKNKRDNIALQGKESANRLFFYRNAYKPLIQLFQ